MQNNILNKEVNNPFWSRMMHASMTHSMCQVSTHLCTSLETISTHSLIHSPFNYITVVAYADILYIPPQPRYSLPKSSQQEFTVIPKQTPKHPFMYIIAHLSGNPRNTLFLERSVNIINSALIFRHCIVNARLQGIARKMSHFFDVDRFGLDIILTNKITRYPSLRQL